MPTTPPNARSVALSILARWTDSANPPLVPERDARAWQDLPSRDRSFAFDIVSGVIRWRGMLDAVIASRLTQPPGQLEPKVRAILWLGAYQLLLHAGSRSYASVHSAVELARTSGAARAAGLINAVLRGITRLQPVVEVRHGLSRQTFPRDFTTHIRFDANVFPDPAADVAAHLAAATSHPRALVNALIRWHGEDTAVNILIRNNQRPLVILRADTPDFSPDSAAGLVAHETSSYFVAADGWNDTIAALVAAGTLSPQDPTAGKLVRAAHAALPNAARILDLCAGLGTKSIQAARAWPEAQIVSSDIDAPKLGKLAARAQQLDLPRLATVAPGDLGGSFDVVLVDAPCSNTGVMARRVQSRWRWPSLDHASLAPTQRDLISKAISHLRPAGILAYATCAIDPDENAGLIADVRALHPDLQLIRDELTLPSFSDTPAHAHDGGYYAVLRISR